MRKSLLAGTVAAVAALVPVSPAVAGSITNTYICIDYTYVWVGGVPVPTVRQVSITSYPVCDTNIPLP